MAVARPKAPPPRVDAWDEPREQRSKRTTYWVGFASAAMLATGIFIIWALAANVFDSRQTAKALMDQLNAAGFECQATQTGLSQPLFSFDWGACEHEGERISVVTFPNADARERYDGVAEDFGGGLIKGPTWRITTEDADTAREIHDAMGGDLKILE